ncbi:Opacity protein opA54 [Neisseria lactamica]|uniref:Opacity protein opA54 n=1 Tax=Neisseria lactamica TaxID=486 RepID=A0AAU8VFB7_NEILA|nr:opacity family porin [Neisseria lactamica]ARB04595.1 Opacity protein opA54 [Neisseria lactamica]
MQPPKKPFSSLLFSSLLFSSAAQAASEDNGRGPYVQADLNYAYEHITHDYPADNAKVFDDYRDIKTRSTHPRLSVGYDFGNWRIALDYARYNKWKHGKHIHAENTKKVKNGTEVKTIADHTDKGTFKAESNYGISAIYDFDTGTRFKPYAGVRVGLGKIRHSITVEDKADVKVPSVNASLPGYPKVINNIHDNRSIRRVGFGAVAGVGIDITPNLTLDTGYRYHNWGRLENTRLKTHEASLGVRYRF